MITHCKDWYRLLNQIVGRILTNLNKKNLLNHQFIRSLLTNGKISIEI
jgi:hypothetical protein